MAGDDATRRRAWGAGAAAGWILWLTLACAWAVTLLLAPVLPLQDVPDWSHQAWLLQQHLAGAPGGAGVELKPYPVPNTTVTLTLAALQLMLSADAAARVGSALVFGLLALGVARLAQAHAEQEAGWLAALLLSTVGLASPFYYGYLQFTLALGLLALFLARERHRPHSALGLASWALALFFTHAIALASFAGLIGWQRLIRRGDRAVVGALALPAVLGVWYVAGRVGDGDLAMSGWSDRGAAASIWEHLRWKPITAATIAPWREFRSGALAILGWDVLVTHAFLAFNMIFAGGLIGGTAYALRNRMRAGEITPADAVPGALLALAFLAAPPVDFFGLINVGERFWLLAVLLLLPLARLPHRWLVVAVLATVPAHTSNLLSAWRIDRPTMTVIDQRWHPFVMPFAGRLFHFDRIAAGDARPIEPGYATGLLRNR